MKIGFGELLIIMAVALLVIGPDKLPAYMKALGKGMKSLQGAVSGLSDDVQENIVDPLNETQRPIKEAADSIQADLNGMKSSVNNIGKKTYVPKDSWICPSCKTRQTGRFCSCCGTKKPEKESTESSVNEEKGEA